MNRSASLPSWTAALLFSSVFVTFPSLRAAEPDWAAVDAETLQHFQAMVRIDTADPPGREIDLTNYLIGVLQAEGISVETFATDPNRPNLVARLKGNGSKQPLLLMA